MKERELGVGVQSLDAGTRSALCIPLQGTTSVLPLKGACLSCLLHWLRQDLYFTEYHMVLTQYFLLLCTSYLQVRMLWVPTVILTRMDSRALSH